jgi:hypothetical protein
LHFGQRLLLTPGFSRSTLTLSLEPHPAHWTVMFCDEAPGAPGRGIFVLHLGQTAAAAPAETFAGSSFRRE